MIKDNSYDWYEKMDTDCINLKTKILKRFMSLFNEAK